MIVSIKPPSLLRKRYEFTCQTLWITYSSISNEPSFFPERLEFEVMDKIANFVKQGGRCLLLHGLEYVSKILPQKDIFRFVRGIEKLSRDITIIIAINYNVDEWSSLGKVTYSKDLKIPEAMVLLREPPKDAKVFRISNREHNAEIFIATNQDAETLVFSGIENIKKENRNIFIDCMDYLLSVLEPTKVMSFLKDVEDIALSKGNKVYISPHSSILQSDISAIIEEKGTEVREEAFIGRAEEMNSLLTFLNDVVLGDGKTVFISGEAGIGKTTIVNHLIAHAVSRGFVVFRSRAYYNTDEPYFSIREAFKDQFRMLTENIPRRHIDNDRTLETHRASMFYEFTQRIQYITEKNPLLVFMDDVQWMDPASLRLLHYMSEHLKSFRAMIVCTYRPEDANETLRDVMRRMTREHLINEIHLRPLTHQETREMIMQITNMDINEDILREIYQKTGGNPLFTREIIIQIERTGKNPKDIVSEKIDLPRIIKDLIDERMSKLGDVEKNIVRIGSLIGDFIDIELIAHIASVDAFDALEVADRIVSAGLWVENEEREGFSFRHSIIREGIAAEISRVKRKYIHRKIAMGMEKKYGEKHYPDIAYHYRMGEMPKKAVEYYKKAGEYAEKIYAYENAVKMYMGALEIEKDAELLEKMGYAYSIMGDYDNARKYLWDGLEIPENNEQKKRLYRILSKTFESQGDFKKALKYIDAGLKVDKRESKETAKLLGMKGWIITKEGRYKEALELLYEERDMANSIHDKEGVANSYDHLGILYYRMGDYDKAIFHLKKSLDMAREIEDKPLECAVLNNLGIVYEEMGKIDTAVEYYEESAKIAEKINDKYTLGAILNNISVAYQDRGDLEKSMNYLRRAMKIEEMLGDKFGYALSLDNIGNIYREMGNIEEAIKYHLTSIQVGKDIDSKSTITESMVSLAEDYINSGDYKIAKKYAMDALEIAKSIRSKPFIRAANRTIAEIYRETGDYETSLNYFMFAMPPKDETELAEMGFTCFELALLYKKMGKTGDANNCFQKALRIFEKMGFQRWTEKTRKAMS